MKIKNTDKHGYKRILIVEVNWLGDVLFSTPFIRAIREKFKDAYIACMSAPRTEAILEDNPRINEIIVYDEKGKHKSLLGKWSLISSLRKGNFDLAIILHRSFTRALMTYLAGIRERAGFATKKRRLLLTHPIELPDEDLHKVEYFLKIAESLGCNIASKDYEFFIKERDEKYIEEELAKNGVKAEEPLIVINAGGNWPPKKWPEERFAELGDLLVKKYNVKVVITGAEKDMESAIRIKKQMRENLIVFTGKTNLKELGALMKRANFVISGDSGPMHIAVAMKTNVIALFGPTASRLTGPYGSGNYKVIQKDIGCEIPCYDFTCRDYRCMEAITVEDVIRVFDEMYSKSIVDSR